MKNKGEYKKKCCYPCNTPYPETVIWYSKERNSYCCKSCAIMANNGTRVRYERINEKNR